MYSFSFPSMLSTVNSRLKKDKDAVRSNVILILQTEKTTLFGDPYFGTQLKRVLFEQATGVIADLIIDEIFTTLVEFLPQIHVRREDISVYAERENIFATIKYTYILDNTVDIYTINLTDMDTTSS